MELMRRKHESQDCSKDWIIVVECAEPLYLSKGDETTGQKAYRTQSNMKFDAKHQTVTQFGARAEPSAQPPGSQS
jgi:hypothetical protein